MGGDVALDMMAQMLILVAKILAPIVLAAMAVGLLVSILQVATQIQEMTLTFIPKIAVVLLVMLLLGHWMLGSMTEYATSLIKNIPNMVGK